MFYVVAYDIGDDRRRDRTARCLADFGSRVQGSVFECLLDEPRYAALLGAIVRLGLDPRDRLRVYRLCSRCVDAVYSHGPGALTVDPPFFVV